MSSRFPPTNPSDPRYLRDRSPSRPTDRRPSGTYNDGLPPPRSGEPGYRSNDSYGYSARGRELAREPPRAPKADLVGPRGGFVPRARGGYIGRGDARDRDSRDFRDDSFPRRGGRGQDWSARDRFDGRDRRISPGGRDRSRSPLPRDFRDPRDTRDFPPRDDLRRDSREGPLSATSSVSDSFPFRGRGGYRGRGRGDYDFNKRGRGLYSEEHEDLGPRNHSRDREWERQMRDDRDRDRDLEASKRDEDARKEREDREREDRFRRDLLPFRPNSRNSTGGAPTPLTSRSTSATSLHQGNLDRLSQNYHDPRDLPSDQRPKPPGSNVDTRVSSSDRDLERGDQYIKRVENNRYDQRAASPPPQAPPVPAFGSIPHRVPTVVQDSQAKQDISQNTSPLIHPSRLGLLDASRETPSAPKSHILSHAPTAPKGQQAQERWLPNEGLEPAKRLLDNDLNRFGPSRQPPATPANSTAKEAAYEQIRNISKRFSQPRAELDTSSVRPMSSGISDSAQPSVRKAVEEQGRNGNLPPPASPASGPRAQWADVPNQGSPIKIPTGPRAERAAASIRPPAPAIRGPSTRPSQMMRGIPGRPSMTRVWVNPNLPQHIPRGPSIMNSVQPSIMNTVPTKRDLQGEEMTRAGPPSAESAESAIAEWRRSNAMSGVKPPGSAVEKSHDSPRSKMFPDTITKDSSGSALEPRKPSISDPMPKRIDTDKSKDEESDGAAAEDGQMDYDEEDFAEAEKKFDREMQALEAKRPPTPRSHPLLLELLEELDALASALEEKTKMGSAEGESATEPAALGLPSPKIEESDRMDLDYRERDNTPVLQLKLRPQTPPIESLPFLNPGPPTPFSDIEELQEDLDRQEKIKTLLTERFVNQRDALKVQDVQARTLFARQYKPWRNDVEDFEDQRRAEDAMAVSPGAENAPIPVPAPPTVGRRGKIISELDMEEVLRVSQETAAKEEQVRREREAPVYVPPDTFNSEREAVVPDMLTPYEVETSMFDDTNNLVDPELALVALGFFPKQDDFTPAEHEAFLCNYMLYPKRFGAIADAIEGRNYQDCVQHYYLTKRTVKYKDQEAAFLKTRKGKRFAASIRNAQIRPKSNALMLTYDGVMDFDAQNVALTEKGRPRRAAAPTFGETGDGEPATPAATPARRNAAAGKENANGNLSSEKPTAKRTRTVPAKVGRKPKAPLLAAAPGPSPQKSLPNNVRALSKEPPLENEQRMEDVESPQLRAGHISGQSYAVPMNQQGPVEGWLTNQPTPMMIDPTQKHAQPPGQDQPRLPQARGNGQGATSSYWSVPEQQDFYNFLRYFGTDWQAISNTMKTKTHTMIKNFYNREIQKGDFGKALEADGQHADDRRAKGEDMGALPAPTPTEKRRYGNNISRDPQRPLAPNVESAEVESVSPTPGIIPMKSQPSSHFKQTPHRFTALASAEGAAAVSSQMQAQGQNSLANRITIPLQSRTPQQSQGPRIGTFTEERSRPSWKSQNTEIDHRQQQQQMQMRLQLQEQEQQQERQNQKRHQDTENQMHHQQRIQPQETQQAAQQAQQHPPNRISNPLHSSLFGPTAQLRIAPSQTIDVEMDEKARKYMQIREQRQQQQQQQQQAAQQAPQQQLQQLQPQIDTSSAMRRLGSSPYSNQFNSNQSPASATLAVPPMSPPGEMFRPSSVPVSASSQQVPREPPKKSSIMDLLNNEPAEPQPPKKQSDLRVAAPTPPPVASAPQYQPPSQPMQQQIQRRETPAEPIHHLQQQQRSSFNQQSQHQQQVPQAREITRSWPAAVQPIQRPFFDERNAQAQSTISPQTQSPYVPTSSRSAFQALHRHHAPSPPPFSHSRNSSYTSLQSQHQHQSAQPHHQQHQHQIPVPSTPAEPNIRPSPYASLNPHQHQQPQHQSQALRLQLQQQQQQQREQQLDARGIIRDHHLRQDPEEVRRQQEALHQHRDALRIQQQDALRQQQQQQEALRQRQDLVEYQENIMRQEQEKKASMRREREREREERERTAYGGTFYHGGDGGGVQGRGLGGEYEERR